MKRAFRFWLGVVILVGNEIMWWGGTALLAILAVKNGKDSLVPMIKSGNFKALVSLVHDRTMLLYVVIFVALFFISWALIFVGGYLAGKEGIGYTKALFRKIFRRQKAENKSSNEQQIPTGEIISHSATGKNENIQDGSGVADGGGEKR